MKKTSKGKQPMFQIGYEREQTSKPTGVKDSQMKAVMDAQGRTKPTGKVQMNNMKPKAMGKAAKGCKK